MYIGVQTFNGYVTLQLITNWSAWMLLRTDKRQRLGY